MHRDGKQLIPMPTTIGACTFINDLRLEEIRRAVGVFEGEFAECRIV